MQQQAWRACAAALILSSPLGLATAAPQLGFPGEQVFVQGPTGSARLVAGDLDGDGRDDLVLGSDASRLEVFRGLATGDLAPWGSVPLAGQSRMKGPVEELALAHLDADGELDLLVAFEGRLWTASGDGQGGFSPLALVPNPGQVQGLATGDMNGDGRTDVLVSLVGLTPGVAVHLQLAQGGFAPALLSPLAWYPSGLCTGDFDEDGALDVAVCDGWVYVAPGDGQGGFLPGTTYSINYHWVIRSVVAGRFVGGFLDLMVDGGLLLVGNGDGTFIGAPGLAGPAVVVDWNADGLDDLVRGEHELYVFSRSSIDGSRLPSPPGLRSAAPCDVDGDGRVDLAFASRSLDLPLGPLERFSKVGVLLGDGAGGVRGLVRTPPAVFAAQAHQLAADLDADGDPDVVHAIGSDLVVQRGDGRGGYLAPEPTGLPAGALEVALGDFGGDALPDLVVRDAAQQVRVLINLGASFQPQAPGHPGIGSERLAVGDLDGDGDDDVVVGHASAGVAALLNDGTGALGAPVGSGVDVPAATYLFALADLDGDAFADLVVAARQQGVWTWKGQGDGSFTPWTYRALEAPAKAAALGDVDADGVADLAVGYSDAYVCKCYASYVSVLAGDGHGGWRTESERVWVGLGAEALRLVDLDGDGNLDVLADLEGEVAVLRGDGAFGLERALHFASPARITTSSSFVRTLGIGDANGDGKLDLIFADQRFPGTGLGLAVALQE